MENEPQPPYESLSALELVDVLEKREYIEPEDSEFLREQIADEENPLLPEQVLGYIYRRLLELGNEDPDAVLLELGVIEE